MISKRTSLSLAQMLECEGASMAALLLEKHGIAFEAVALHPGYGQLSDYGHRNILEAIRACVSTAQPGQLMSLIQEVVRTSGDLRTRVSPKYSFDERFKDLTTCLELDGYRVDGKVVVPIDPSTDIAEPVEDDLQRILNETSLPKKSEITSKLRSAVEEFRKDVPNYNACLNDLRIALQTLVTDVANSRSDENNRPYDESKWGQVLANLRVTGLISKQEEEGISGVFTFLSPGSHRTVGLSEGEMARLALFLCSGMCYFVVKVHAGAN